MKKNSQMVYLAIYDKNIIKYIPFKSLKDLDTFTTTFSNKNELLEALNKLLKLDIDCINNIEIDIGYFIDKYEDGQLSIRYFDDNYNIEIIKSQIIKFLFSFYSFGESLDRLKSYGINLNQYFIGRRVDEYFLQNTINDFFDDANYETIRNVYFVLKGYNITKKEISSNDNYQNESSIDLDELSKNYDLDNLPNEYRDMKVFDGLGPKKEDTTTIQYKKKINNSIRRLLKKTTGRKKIEDIRKSIVIISNIVRKREYE